jgi:hypothetical protein
MDETGVQRHRARHISGCRVDKGPISQGDGDWEST